MENKGHLHNHVLKQGAKFVVWTDITHLFYEASSTEWDMNKISAGTRDMTCGRAKCAWSGLSDPKVYCGVSDV